MNTLTFTHPTTNQEFSFKTPLSEEETKVQMAEVFVEEQYKFGKVKKDMVIVDVGANIGSTAIYFKEWAKKIYALEPSSLPFQALKENVAPYTNIEAFNLGVGPDENKWKLYSNDGGQVPLSMWGNGVNYEEVQLTTLDKFFKEQKIEHVDLLKIDTEGSEYLIFPSPGFTNIASKIDYIVGEAHYPQRQVIPEFIPLILEESGFDVKFLPEENYSITFAYNFDGENKKYELIRQTMFVAKRKELEWPN